MNKFISHGGVASLRDSYPNLLSRWVACAGRVLIALLPAIFSPSWALAQTMDGNLANYYRAVIPSQFPVSSGYTINAFRVASPPVILVKSTGSRFLPYYSGDELLFVVDGARWGAAGKDVVLWSSMGSHYACPEYQRQFVLPTSISGGQIFNYNATWYTPFGVTECSDTSNLGPAITGRWQIRDVISFGAPERRRAGDGGEFDASRMHVARNGTPWISYYWGYKLGLVESASEWSSGGLSVAPELSSWPDLPTTAQDYALSSLPPVIVEDDVVEYVNRIDFPNQPDGQYFYAVLAADKSALDAVAAWQRTGRTFKSGGYVSACRFYGGKSGGPNTHFYSSDAAECSALKSITTLSYEGQTFAINAPLPAKNAAQSQPGALRDCPLNSKPLYRLYNNASVSGGRFVSNHRYTTDTADIDLYVSKGWKNEGHVMCVPL